MTLAKLKALLNEAFSQLIENKELNWVRLETDKGAYKLVDRNGLDYGKVWKSGSDWGTLAGQSFRTFKDAKGYEQDRIKLAIFTTFEELNSRMTATPRKDEDAYFRMMPLERDVLGKMLSTYLGEKIEQCATLITNIKMRDTGNRLGNSVAAFDCDGKMASFLEAGVNYRAESKGISVINPLSIGFTAVIHEDIDGRTLTEDESFGPNGRSVVPLNSLEEADLARSAVTLFRRTNDHLGLKRKMILKSAPGV